MTKKKEFFQSVQTLSPMWWVFRDRLGGLVSPLKRFYDHSQFRRKNREKQVKKSTFWPWGPPKTKKKSKNDQKIEFFKSVQTLSPMWWVFRDRLGGLVSPLKRFYDNFRFRKKKSRKTFKKSIFLALGRVNLQNW